MFKFLKNIFTARGKASTFEKSAEPTLSSEQGYQAKEEKDKNSIEVIVQKPSTPLDKDSIEVSLKSIVDNMPDELKQNVLKVPPESLKIRIPREKILAQLRSGAVKIKFSELRSFSPGGMFLTNPHIDNEQVVLPLKEIIPRIDISQFKLQCKREVVVPEEIGDIFLTKELVSRVKPVTPKFVEQALRKVEQEKSEPVQETIAIRKSLLEKETKPVTTAEKPFVSVDMRTISLNWKPEIKQQIESLGLLDSIVNIPIDELEPKIKNGNVVFDSQKILSWATASTSRIANIPNIPLELPLKNLVPLFLPHIHKNTPRKTIPIPSDIPDIFKPAIQVQQKATVEPSPAIAEVEIRTREKIVEEKFSEVQTTQPGAEKQLEELKPIQFREPIQRQIKSLNELFEKPDKKTWTPNEIVQNTIKLEGVSGAMIALKEGLPVSSSLPNNLNPDLLAGIVPQIFMRLSQYTGELKLPNLTSITLYCDGIPVFICLCENIYFIVVGKKGENLPSVFQLQSIAEELVKLNKK